MLNVLFNSYQDLSGATLGLKWLTASTPTAHLQPALLL